MIAETVCSAVAVAGLGIAGVLAFRKRFLKAARTAAYALVPLGLVMTGAVEWIVDTAFSPTAWAGFGVLGVAWLMFMGTRAVERRRSGRSGKEREAAIAPAASAPSLGESRRPTPAVQPKQPKQAKAEPAEDFSDIEAILKKHGI
ncbi:DUF2306 domain-containing protein [Streptomyces endophyticus]|uniref:DUF2306 domain-containing protein n=1 Tax=Streptomyces endophyticus TaxID=714166 RepID=A0ABU6EY15_9ACTN|nr:hypothetical protein [Streptomyces endophyticus]MEB8336648.1 DUF2306 domain-containing protein [Streptomyces endophyticus]